MYILLVKFIFLFQFSVLLWIKIRKVLLLTNFFTSHFADCCFSIGTRLKMTIHESKFSRYSSNWLNCDPCMSKLVVQKLIYWLDFCTTTLSGFFPIDQCCQPPWQSNIFFYYINNVWDTLVWFGHRVLILMMFVKSSGKLIFCYLIMTC